MANNRCQATTKKGTRCRNGAVEGLTTCMGHASREEQESRGFGGSQKNAGRPPVPRTTDVQRHLVTENAIAVLRPYWITLGYDVRIVDGVPQLEELPDGGAKLFGESKEGDINVSQHEDLGAMINASEKLQDRVFGRPKQTQELTGAGGEPLIPVKVPAGVDRAGEVAEILAEVGAVPGPMPAVNGNGNGNGNGHH